MKIGRNDPCPCGSGKKYKKCCENAPRSLANSEPGLPRADAGNGIQDAENLYRAGQHARAADICGQILARNPRHIGALRLLGRIRLRGGGRVQATELFRTALEISPSDIQSLYFCGRALGESGRIIEAIPYLEKAVELDSRFAEGYNFLGTLLHVMGRTDEAAALALKAVQLDRNNPALHSHQLVCAHSCSRYSAADLFGFHKEWAARHASRFHATGTHANSPDSKRRIRIGYVSPRFNRDIVGYFYKPVFDSHDRDNFEIFCYSNTRVQDDVTAHFARLSTWRNITELSDEETADLIRRDEIDILVDLAGHTPNNRLLVFARKPAPVQVTWLDYFDTTGMETMDYLITDPVSTPENGSQQFIEKPVRMPHIRFCWSPLEYAPEVSPPPVLTRGVVTFGSFNRPEKLTQDVIAVWAAILRGTPGSRLILKNRNFSLEDTRGHFLKAFEGERVTPERLEMRGESPHEKMLQEYADIDIALDPFPYNGGATTCDALLMGVPVISLKGNRMISRQTAGILTAIGRAEFIADDEASYVRTAVEWSRMTGPLTDLRKQLRQQLTSSPVCDASAFTSDLERIYRQIWEEWCARAGSGV